jgi:hypothetical protein
LLFEKPEFKATSLVTLEKVVAKNRV